LGRCGKVMCVTLSADEGVYGGTLLTQLGLGAGTGLVVRLRGEVMSRCADTARSTCGRTLTGRAPRLSHTQRHAAGIHDYPAVVDKIERGLS